MLGMDVFEGIEGAPKAKWETKRSNKAHSILETMY